MITSKETPICHLNSTSQIQLPSKQNRKEKRPNKLTIIYNNEQMTTVWKPCVLIWIIEHGVLQYVVQGYIMFSTVRFERQPTYVALNEERHL